MDHARPQQAGRRYGNVEDRRFDADLGLTTIDDEFYAVCKGFANVVRVGWR
jgi:hypothetical protein